MNILHLNSTFLICQVKLDDGVWHVRIHEALPCNGGALSVHSHKVAGSGDEPLGYF